MFEIGSRPGRDAKWKEGGTGLKAEMGNEGSSSSAAAAAGGGDGSDAPLLLLLLLLLEPTSQKLTEIWRKNFMRSSNEAERVFSNWTQIYVC